MKKLIISVFLALLTQCNVALSQWLQVTNPGADGVSCLTEFNGDIYAGTGNGIFVSKDSGKSWIAANIGLKNTRVSNFAVIGENIFAGMMVDSPADGVLFLSTNSGESWSDVSSGLPPNSAVDAMTSRDGNLFAGLGNPQPATPLLFLSTDSGAHWSEADAGLNNSRSTTWPCSFALKGNDIFVSLIDGGVSVSTNNGTNWNSVSNGLPSGSHASMNALAVNGGNIFAVSSNIDQPDTTSTGVYRSTDNGTSWVAVNDGLTDTIVNDLISYNGNLFASTTTGVFLSTNNGDTWQYLNGEGQQKFNVYALLVHDGYLFASDFFAQELWRLPLSGLNLSSVVANPTSNTSSTLRVFPNPATDELQILGGQAGTIHLFDIMGRERITANGDGTSTTLDVSSLESGIYFLRVGNQSTKVEIAR